jgi:hypothetical protein
MRVWSNGFDVRGFGTRADHRNVRTTPQSIGLGQSGFDTRFYLLKGGEVCRKLGSLNALEYVL